MQPLKLTLTITSFFVGLILLIASSYPQSVAKAIVCDVGQGDSILVVKNDIQVLIDGGPVGDRVLSCLARHTPFWDRTIELIVFTNTDYDHLNGLNSILPRYQIGKIITGDGIGESDAVVQFVAVLQATNNRVEQVGAGDLIKLGKGNNTLTFNVIWPPTPNPAVMSALNPDLDPVTRNRVLGINVVKNVNERSVVLLLNENNKKLLLTGDIGEPTERALLQQGALTDIDVLKVGHHGSKFSSSTAFLSVLKPELALISVGAKNRYGHPTDETLFRLDNVGAKILRTDQEGDIVISLE